MRKLIGINADSAPGENMKPCLICASLLSIAVLSGCVSTASTSNEPITAITESEGYRRFDTQTMNASGDTIVLLAFSGGGTRAAALSYGVMQELRDTLIDTSEGQRRLLDEVDTISSVSGGSFTSAYYGVFRDGIFDSFETDFLRAGMQQALVDELLNPIYWVKSATSGFNRTEMAIDHYDQHIFRGATFSDIEENGPPFIEINATDLTTGMRFTFNQERFDLICSSLSEFSVARAVAASSAVPIVFPTIPLKNYADRCDISGTEEWLALEQAEFLAETRAQQELIQMLKSYRDAEQRQYIHLVDGGVSDNLGLRSLINRLEIFKSRGIEIFGERAPKNILLISVNAEVKRSYEIESSPDDPPIATTMSAYTSSQMHRSNRETIDRLESDIADLKEQFQAVGIDTEIYFSKISFDQVPVKDVNAFLNSLPTSLELEDIQVDRLIGVGRLMLRMEPAYARFINDNQARIVDGALTNDQICQQFEHSSCDDSVPVQ